MTEFSGLWTTNAAGSGHQVASYTQAQLSTMLDIVSACSHFEGVAPGYRSELEASDGGANTVDVAAGGAIVDGKFYDSDAIENINIPSAAGAGNTRIDRIVLRADWGGYEVALHRIEGTDAADPSAPSITQTSGTTYDIQICQVLVDTSGNVTVTDEREWAELFTHRQGGGTSDWSTPGTTDYTLGATRVQGGSVEWTGSATNGSVTITFPTLFSGAPLVFCTYVLDVGGPEDIIVGIYSPTTSEVDLIWKDAGGTTQTSVMLNWLAIGPR